MNPQPANIVTLLIPKEVAQFAVSGYKACGDYIKPETVKKRELSNKKRVEKLKAELATLKYKSEKAAIQKQIDWLTKANTHQGNRTNTMRKIVGMFITLKALTPSGCIENYSAQKPTLEQYTKKNFRTIEHYLDQMQDLDLLKICGHKYAPKTIRLGRWESLCNLFDVAFTNDFITYEYDLDNTKQHPDYILDAVEEFEKQERLTDILISSVRRNHRVCEYLASQHNITTINRDAINKIEAIRQHVFVNSIPSGSAQDEDHVYSLHFLYNLNTCLYRTRSKIVAHRNYLSSRTTTRLRKQLKQREIALVENRKLTTKNKQMRVPDRQIHGNGFDLKSKASVWFLPTLIKVPKCSTSEASHQ